MYQFVVCDSRDIDSDWGPESALCEVTDIAKGWPILFAHLEAYPTIYSWFVIAPDNSVIVRFNHAR